MKVVFFTYAYPPLKYPRSSQIARLVKHSRHKIHVICCDDDSPTDDTLESAAGNGAEQVTRLTLRPRVRLDPRRASDRVIQPDPLRRWALGTGERTLAQICVEPETVLVTFGQPMSDHLAGLRVKRKTKVRWLAHFSDPWADSPYRLRGFYPRWHNRRMERAVLGAVDRAIFVSRATLDLAMAKYPSDWRQRATALPHAFDESLYEGANGARDGDQPLIFRYIGNFYNRRWPSAFLEALAVFCRETPELVPGLRIEFIGPEAVRADRGAAPKLPEGLVSFHPPVGYLESLELMREADLLLVLDAPHERSVFLPSKLVDYLGSGTPIMAISPPGPAAELVARLGGSVANVNDVDEIARRLAVVVEQLRANGHAANAPWGDQEVRAEYAAPAVTARLDDLIDEVAGLERV